MESADPGAGLFDDSCVAVGDETQCRVVGSLSVAERELHEQNPFQSESFDEGVHRRQRSDPFGGGPQVIVGDDLVERGGPLCGASAIAEHAAQSVVAERVTERQSSSWVLS